MAGLPLEDWQADALQVMLSHRADGSWAAREYAEWVGRQQGKSMGIGVPRALAGLLLLDEHMIMWSAHEVKTALEAFLQLRTALENLGEPAGPNLIALDDGGIMVKVVNNNGYEGFTLSNGRRMRFVARSKGSGRGFSGDCNLIDEAFAYTRQQQSALAPTQLARPNPQTVYLSSPPLRAGVAEGEVMFALAERAAKGDEKLGYRDWGLPVTLDELREMSDQDTQAVLDDRSNWAASLPALGRGRVTEASIEQLRSEMSDLDFAREVLGCWPAPATGGGLWLVIAEQAWAGLADQGSQFTDRPVMSVDVTPDQSASAVAAAGWRLDTLGHVEVVRHEPGTGWLLPEILRLNDRHRPKAWLLDPASPAGSLLEELQEHHIEPVLVTGREMAQACSAFYRGAAETAAFRHRDQADLNKAAAHGTKRKLADAWAWDKASKDVDISPLVAVTLAWHGAQKHKSDGPFNIW